MKKILLWTIIIVLLIAVAIFVIPDLVGNPGSNTDSTPEMTKEQKEKQLQIEAEQGIESVPQASVYTNTDYGFSFQKPEGFVVGVIPEAEGEVVLVQQAAPSSNSPFPTRGEPSRTKGSTPQGGGISHSGFQVYVTPLSESVTLTPNFIKSELPNILIKDPKAIQLDGKANGIMFASNAEAFDGSSYEIWFVHNGHLYQATSYAQFAEQLKEIIGTWKFN